MPLRRFYTSVYESNCSCLVRSFSLLLVTMSCRVFFYFPQRDHKPPSALRDRLNPHPYLQRRQFPSPCYDKRPDVALDAIALPFILPIPSSPPFILKVSECMCGQHFQQGMDQSGIVDNPARGQLYREKYVFPIPGRA